MTLNFAIDTSRFDPFKYYGAALQTMKDYGTEYRRLEDQMMKIAEQNGQYVLPDTPENQEYRNTIDKYNQAYSAAVESLNRGLNPRLASDIMKVRRQFLSDVNPIYKAVEAYNKDQDKMTALGPDAIIGNKQGLLWRSKSWNQLQKWKSYSANCCWSSTRNRQCFNASS